MLNFLPLPSLSVNTFFFISILWATKSLKDIAFRYICLQSLVSLFLSFCWSLRIALMLSPHMCSRKTKLLICHLHCSKPCVHTDIGLCVCKSESLSLSSGYNRTEFEPESYKEVWNLAWLLCSAAVGAITQAYTQWCGGNVIKEWDACKAKQPQAQNWSTEWEREVEVGNTLDLGCMKHREKEMLREITIDFWINASMSS